MVVVGLVQNMYWTFVFLGQLGAWCSKLEHIIHKYLNNTLVGLTSCAITLAIGSVTFVSTTSFSLFLFWQVSLPWPIFL